MISKWPPGTTTSSTSVSRLPRLLGVGFARTRRHHRIVPSYDQHLANPEWQQLGRRRLRPAIGDGIGPAAQQPLHRRAANRATVGLEVAQVSRPAQCHDPDHRQRCLGMEHARAGSRDSPLPVARDERPPSGRSRRRASHREGASSKARALLRPPRRCLRTFPASHRRLSTAGTRCSRSQHRRHATHRRTAPCCRGSRAREPAPAVDDHHDRERTLPLGSRSSPNCNHPCRTPPARWPASTASHRRRGERVCGGLPVGGR